MDNVLCCNCGTVNESKKYYCETCGIDLQQFIEIKQPTEQVPIIPNDMLKASNEQPFIKYDRELF